MAKVIEHLFLLSPRKVDKCFQLASEMEPPYLLGDAYIQKEYLTTQQVMDICDLLNKAIRKFQDLIYSKIALEKGLISEQDVRDCLANLGNLRPRTYQMLREKRSILKGDHIEICRIQQEQMQAMDIEMVVQAILKIVEEMKEAGTPAGLLKDDLIGERAVGLGWIDFFQLRAPLAYQVLIGMEGLYRPIGHILVTMEILTASQYEELQFGASLSSPIEGYQVLRKVGQGAMGNIYKCIQNKDGREVALKVLLPKITQSPDDLKRFLRGAKFSLGLNHPKIVLTLDMGKFNQLYFQSMEFIRGETVMEYMKRNGPLDEVIGLTIVAEVASGLAYLDSKGLVHRDVKPHNIMMTHMGQIKLADLGIVKEKEANTRITADGISIGSPHYISPEQALGEEVDIRSDFYSLGASLYHMIVGQYPYTGKSGPEILYQQVHSPPPNPKRVRHDVSPETSQLIMNMMAKDPADRPQKPIDLLNVIRHTIRSIP